jgi:hypothetical protein
MPWPAYHARAGERVPAEADAIPVLDIAPLVLQCLKVGHLVLVSGVRSRAEGGWWDSRRPQVELAGR